MNILETVKSPEVPPATLEEACTNYAHAKKLHRWSELGWSSNPSEYNTEHLAIRTNELNYWRIQLRALVNEVSSNG